MYTPILDYFINDFLNETKQMKKMNDNQQPTVIKLDQPSKLTVAK